MFKNSLQSMNELAREKTKLVNDYLLLAMLGGAYVGLGAILALSVGAPLASASLPVVFTGL
ncbi:hypothetical protein [Priestia aryabhattai]|uniref:hypothetical protein n=1 Tax=Priestia aryabhattai TaxID=412384 RepID=UPI0020D26D27|nr:hypothetical protein [Priestia aryabhattai]